MFVIVAPQFKKFAFETIENYNNIIPINRFFLYMNINFIQRKLIKCKCIICRQFTSDSSNSKKNMRFHNL